MVALCRPATDVGEYISRRHGSYVVRDRKGSSVSGNSRPKRKSRFCLDFESKVRNSNKPNYAQCECVIKEDYAILVAMFFCANVCNNYAFNFNIPMPLHMIFRAGSLIANMVMGILILKKKYSLSKYLSVFMITLGISICTIISGKDVKATTPLNQVVPEQSEMEGVPNFSFNVCFSLVFPGILLLTVALFVSARMGIYQEVLYGRYGKHPRESLYYTVCTVHG
ncbi:hypothetical protein Cfor_03400 [Coptotermes formosanus]|uniref:Uncharacterized protein n=1 Tax=Coptotermes formosanus TaxID=36987 RepID=A0A6L2Q7L6_COPFO|nr:hypothetical protein Cfor_03400 [Coptotermes formosanus]